MKNSLIKLANRFAVKYADSFPVDDPGAVRNDIQGVLWKNKLLPHVNDPSISGTNAEMDPNSPVFLKINSILDSLDIDAKVPLKINIDVSPDINSSKILIEEMPEELEDKRKQLEKIVANWYLPKAKTALSSFKGKLKTSVPTINIVKYNC